MAILMDHNESSTAATTSLANGPDKRDSAAGDDRSHLQWFFSGIAKRMRLFITRWRYRRLIIGDRTDVRRRFVLRQSRQSQVTIGSRCVLDNDLTIESRGRLSIGDRTIFGHHCTIACNESLTIGEDCLIAEMVSLRDHDHCFERLDQPTRSQGAVCARVVIGNNVWLGAKVTVTKGVTIGDNAVIGAHAVVTRDIPANAIAVGIPARVIRMRNGTAV
jgi:acetyltransferase-like isoleucine patch superfamily enzyme